MHAASIAARSGIGTSATPTGPVEKGATRVKLPPDLDLWLLAGVLITVAGLVLALWLWIILVLWV